MILEMWNNGWPGRIILVAFLLLIVCLTLFVFHYFADSLFLPKQEGLGIVKSKHFTNGYVTTTMIMSGKTMVPITNHYPDTYSVVFSMDDKEGDIPVTQCFYDQVKVGDQYRLLYSKGRISDYLYIDEIL